MPLHAAPDPESGASTVSPPELGAAAEPLVEGRTKNHLCVRCRQWEHVDSNHGDGFRHA